MLTELLQRAGKGKEAEMQDKGYLEGLMVSPAPHIAGPMDSSLIMQDVLRAGIPAIIFALIRFGPKALAVLAVSIVSCVYLEAVTRNILGRRQTIGDMSAAVTGMIIAFCCPADIPLWMPAVASFCAIVIAKQLFGGLGQNFANPAVTGVLMMVASYPEVFTSGDTPLELWNNNQDVPGMLDLFIGNTSGCLGEVSAAALLLGCLYMVFRRTIDPITPLVYLASIAASAAFMGFNPLFHVLAGSSVLAAVFMVNDYATTPLTRKGRVIFAVICGMLTMLIRVYSSYPDGVLFAVLLTDLLTPHIDRLTGRRPLFAEGGSGDE